MKELNWMQWALIIETIVVIILIAGILLRNKPMVVSLIKWLKPSAEGENKTASGRRLTAFAITAICYIGGTIAFFEHGIANKIDPNFFLLKFAEDIVFIGLLWGFINQQTIVALKNGGKIFGDTNNNNTGKSKGTNNNDETLDTDKP